MSMLTIPLFRILINQQPHQFSQMQTFLFYKVSWFFQCSCKFPLQESRLNSIGCHKIDPVTSHYLQMTVSTGGVHSLLDKGHQYTEVHRNHLFLVLLVCLPQHQAEVVPP